MSKINLKEITAKWQAKWQKHKIYQSSESGNKPKYYILDMFPYPSGSGLHVGHPKGFVATDITARKKMIEGCNVLHPMGFDAFGLPTEQYAIKNKINPKIAAADNIKIYKQQLDMFGFTYDWDREISSCASEFYRWTQRIFLQLYNHYFDDKLQKAISINELLIPTGLSEIEKTKYINNHRLAFVDYKPINWCPSCKTGLANEDLEGAVCERCGSQVEQKPMQQWVLRITKYAERLLNGLEHLPNRVPNIKESQKNWIGKSQGCEFSLQIVSDTNYLLLHGYKGSSQNNFFPWLKAELETKGYQVQVPDLPNTENPDIHEQVEYVINNCKINENTVILGHSLGTIIAMKIAEKFKVKKLILAAGFWEPRFKDHPRPKLEIAINGSINTSLIQQNVSDITVLHDINDKIIPELQADLLVEKLNGKLIKFAAHDVHITGTEEPELLKHVLFQDSFAVYTTRIDTVYGMTFVVISPEHPIIFQITTDQYKAQVHEYQEQAKRKTALQRTDLQKEKTGVFTGAYAINPFNNKKIPIYIADYVLMDYGTGAVMAVPAHDERDYIFAQKYNLDIITSIIPSQAVYTVIEKSLLPADIKELEKYGSVSVDKVDDERGKFIKIKITNQQESLLINFLKNKLINGRYADSLGTSNMIIFQNKSFKLINEDTINEARNYGLNHGIVENELIFKINAYTDYGILTNSGEFNGLTSEEALEKMTQRLINKGIGKRKINYKLQDWVFSRQRYWGEPFPIIHCPKCGIVHLKSEDLPITLPDVENYEPTGTQEGPLANIDAWVNVICPWCGANARRETNTMPQWAGSSWYWIRFMDPHNNEKLVDPAKEKYWGQVDFYVGGAEHATRHLIYARFWQHFLYDIGIVSQLEPFKRLQNVGMILGEDGRKMSKRWGNVVNPNDVINEFGADTFRIYEMFMGPFDQEIAWSTAGVKGIKKFIDKIINLEDKISDTYTEDKNTIALLHKTIKKIGEDIEKFRFNTAIAQMMILVNKWTEQTYINKNAWKLFVIILAPFAPHLAEEFRERLGEEFSIFTTSKWPIYDPDLIREDTVEIAIQFNGKSRSSINVNIDETQDNVLKIIKNNPKLNKYLTSEIKKIIYIKNKIINIIM